MTAPISSASFAAAYALDWLAGDPHAMPHPVCAMGAAISVGEKWLRRKGSPASEFLRGAGLTGAVVGGSYVVAKAMVRTGGPAVEITLAWAALATRNLLDECTAVLAALDAGDIQLARTRLAMIVGRDPETLDESEIARAVIETAAEGLCDGVVAPLFYLASGGVPLALAFKAASTLDSMIGHREAPYLYFGRAAARLDDAANFVPARITALAIAAAAFLCGADARGSWAVFRRDGGKHPSPNAGQSEAAMAGALGVRLGGLNYYRGEASPKPLLGGEGRPPARGDARAALRIVGIASILVFSAAWLCLRRREARA